MSYSEDSKFKHWVKTPHGSFQDAVAFLKGNGIRRCSDYRVVRDIHYSVAGDEIIDYKFCFRLKNHAAQFALWAPKVEPYNVILSLLCNPSVQKAICDSVVNEIIGVPPAQPPASMAKMLKTFYKNVE